MANEKSIKIYEPQVISVVRIVYRLMRTEGLQAQRGYKRKNNYGGGDLSTAAQNLLDREFNVEKPNIVWVTDITYIRTQEG